MYRCESEDAAHYVDMSAEETEYDGGWNLFKTLRNAVRAVAVAVTVAVAATVICTNFIGVGVAAASIASGCMVGVAAGALSFLKDTTKQLLGEGASTLGDVLF